MKYTLTNWSRKIYKKYNINNENNLIRNNGYKNYIDYTRDNMATNILNCLLFLFQPISKKKEINIITEIYYNFVEWELGNINDKFRNFEFSPKKYHECVSNYISMENHYIEAEYKELIQFRRLICSSFVFISFLIDLFVTFKDVKLLDILKTLLNTNNILKDWLYKNNTLEHINSKLLFFNQKIEEFQKSNTFHKIGINDSQKFIQFMRKNDELELKLVTNVEIAMNVIYNTCGLYFKSVLNEKFNLYLRNLDIFHIKTLQIEFERINQNKENIVAGLNYLELFGLIEAESIQELSLGYYQILPFIEITDTVKNIVIFTSIIKDDKIIVNKEIKFDNFNLLYKVKEKNEELPVFVKVEFSDKMILNGKSYNILSSLLKVFKKNLINEFESFLIQNKGDKEILKYLIEISKWKEYYNNEHVIHMNEKEYNMAILLQESDVIRKKCMIDKTISQQFHDFFKNEILNREGIGSVFYYNYEKFTSQFNFGEMVYHVLPILSLLFFEILKDNNKLEYVKMISNFFSIDISNIISNLLSSSKEEDVILKNSEFITECLNNSIEKSLELLEFNK